MAFEIYSSHDHCLIRCKLSPSFNRTSGWMSIYRLMQEGKNERKQSKKEKVKDQKKKKLNQWFYVVWKKKKKYFQTFRGVFLASGNSLSSRRSHLWRNCCTTEFSGLIIWKPLMFAPPRNTLSRLMLVKPCGKRWREKKKRVRIYITNIMFL